MPVVASSPFYENEKAGGALENAAEEILNGIFCHYEPPTSTKAQKNAADAVRKDPTKFLYDEQPTKPVLKYKKKRRSSFGSAYSYPSEAEEEDEDYETDHEEDAESVEEEEMSTQKIGKGVKWRDEESKKKIEETEKTTGKSKSSFCISIPFLGIGTPAEDDATKGLVDTHDENSVVRVPDTPGAQTPTKSVLKKTNDMKVLYDDEGNPTSTPRSPGSIHSHPFFRNVSPRNGGVYEPNDYNNPSSTATPRANRKMPLNATPRPDRDGLVEEHGEEQVERLAKIGRGGPNSPGGSSAWAPAPMAPMRPDAKAKTYVPKKSPRTYMMAPSPLRSATRQATPVDDWDAGVESNVPAPAVMDIVQKLNKSGFVPGQRYRKSFHPTKSPGARSDYSDLTMSVVQHNHRGFGEKTSFVGTRRVAAPTPLDLSSPAPGGGGITTDHHHSQQHVDMTTRDPTPRQYRDPEVGGVLRNKTLPPTPRRKEEEAPQEPLVDTNSYSVREQVSAAERTIQETQKIASSKQAHKKKEPAQQRTSQQRGKEQRDPNAVKEKKGFMKGIKKSFGKLKSVVNDIDEQRLGSSGGPPAKSSSNNKRSNDHNNGSKKIVRKDGAVIRHV